MLWKPRNGPLNLTVVGEMFKLVKHMPNFKT